MAYYIGRRELGKTSIHRLSSVLEPFLGSVIDFYIRGSFRGPKNEPYFTKMFISHMNIWNIGFSKMLNSFLRSILK